MREMQLTESGEKGCRLWKVGGPTKCHPFRVKFWKDILFNTRNIPTQSNFCFDS